MSNNPLYIYCLAIVLLCYGCNDAPTEIGTEFLLDTLSVYNLTESDGIITNIRSYKYAQPLARNMGLFLVGQTNNYTAGALLRFNVPTEKKIIASQMRSCKLYLVLNKYAIGDTNSNQLSFDIKEVTSSWSIEQTTANDVLYGSIYGSDITTYNGTITRKDTMDTLVIEFSPELCEKWLRDINDGINITDTTWGIGLLPNANSSIINGFVASSSTANNSYIEIIADTGAAILDTFQMAAGENVSFIESQESVDNSRITAQCGVRIHSKFDIDLNVLPALACVNSAEMILYIDENASDFGNKLNGDTSLSLVIISDSTKAEQSQYISTRILGQYDSTNKRVIFQTFGFDAMNYILRKRNKQGTLILMASSPLLEYSYLDKWVFYGPNTADVSKRPRLKLQTTQ